MNGTSRPGATGAAIRSVRTLWLGGGSSASTVAVDAPDPYEGVACGMATASVLSSAA
jgi:hypothetical protein